MLNKPGLSTWNILGPDDVQGHRVRALQEWPGWERFSEIRGDPRSEEAASRHPGTMESSKTW